METSLYAPPKADLTMPSETSQLGFFVVSQRKFLVLFIATLGMYKIWWFYKNWSNYKHMERVQGGDDANIWPVPRAIFSVFFVHALMHEAAANAEAKERSVTPGFESTATFMVVLMILSAIFDRLANSGIGGFFTYAISVAMVFLMAWQFNIARQLMNESSGDPDGTRNDRYTWANWIWIVIGALLWLMIVVSFFLPIKA